ncbi:tail fiber assembly protein [Pseudomonas huaxiensis]|uniref:phage tail assembly chaperone n=1 Tax=Pseudomonas huaxiensis TaxID=2213017 RepID=UPI000DA6D730|nr:phage tail assembly chaperone [Pseudomonas huaxiensis]
MLYSPSARGFYLTKVHTDIPVDAVEISLKRHAELIKSMSEGKRIVPGPDGLPVADDSAQLTEDQAAARERSWRDGALIAVTWLRDRHRDQHDSGDSATLTEDQFRELLGYMRSLRDWPQSDQFPDEAGRPRAPAWVSGG